MRVLRKINDYCLWIVDAALFDYFAVTMVFAWLVILCSVGTAIVVSIQWAHCVDIVRGIKSFN